MSNVVNIAAFKEQKLTKAYTAYYGTPVEIKLVKRPMLKAVGDYTEDDVAQLQGSIDMSSYMEWLSSLSNIEDDVDIVQWNPDIPW